MFMRFTPTTKKMAVADSQSDNSSSFYVFVYGTLKQGEPNHFWMTKEGTGQYEFIARGQTVNKYPLVIGSKYNVPYLLDVPGQGNQVQGEIYKIDKEKLAHLDILEDYPKYYTRRAEKIKVIGQESHILPCLVYFLVRHKPGLMNLPFLEEYSSAGPHGTPYIQDLDDISDPDDI